MKKNKSKFIVWIPAMLLSMQLYAQKTIIIDPTTQFQTIEGWGHGGGILGHTGGAFAMLDTSIANPVNYQILDYLVDDLGLTGSRTWEVGPRIDGTGMDNGDCDDIDWNKFDGRSLPLGLAQYLIYFQNRVLSKGYQPSFYSSPGYPSHATDLKPWIVYHPGERAQQIWASALYMKNTYGITINYDVIYNEPSGPVSSAILVDDIKALGPRLQAKGLSTLSQYAEAVAPQTDWGFITPVQNDTDFWPWVGRLSYHNYGTADPYRADIYNFGLSKGITTAQTEMGNPTFDDLYNDLTLGGVSYWEVAYSASNTLVPDSGLTSFVPSPTYFRLRQVLHYVTPGSVRIQAVASDSLFHVLSFVKNGLVTTIIDNTTGTAQNIVINGLPSGKYGLCRAAAGGTFFQELGVRTIGAGDTLTIPVNGGSTVTTLYPYSGPNHPPTIMTYKSSPGYLVLPSSSSTLSSSANDTELDALSFHWTVAGNPAGSNPLFTSPNAHNTFVSGLTVAGTYRFNIDVSDGINTTNRDVILVVYENSPPPVLGSCGFRIVAPYGLVFGIPGDTTHANIELPTSSFTLQAGIGDLANSDFTGRGTWSLVQQPTGANCVISATTYIYVSLRATVSEMSVPGDYIFQIHVNNPGHPDLVAQIICTVHPSSAPPVITSITASPAMLTLPASAALLTAVTVDPENDLLRHWWVIKSAPAGAHPVFDHQGLKVSQVSGLLLPGIYTFSLRVFDDLHMTTKDKSIMVNVETETNNILNANKQITVYPNPVSDILTVQTNTSEMCDIALYDITSKKLLQEKFENLISISTIRFPKGIYFYNVRNKYGLVGSGKIVKE